jgi:hypothetical protein
MHSPEPWKHVTGKCLDYIADANGNSVLGDVSLDDPVMPSSEEMKRIVACVNFCRHLPTEYILPRVLHRGAIGPMVDWNPETPPNQWEKHGGPNTGGE